MKPVLCVSKPIGMTPLQAINQFKQHHPEYQTQTISYAGRLDPMAEGLLLLLVGDENKNRKQYENLPKTYEFTVLLGIATDTYDVLGVVKNFKQLAPRNKQIQISQNHDMKLFKPFENSDLDSVRNLEFEISNVLKIFIGKHSQPYPAYSSKTVQGKPLFWWARENKLDEIVIPKRDIEIYDLKLTSIDRISNTDLRLKIIESINTVKGDFRQQEILDSWDTFFQSFNKPANQLTSEPANQTFPLLHCSVTCSSGTYVRSLAVEIGKKLGTPTLALAIKRTQVGEYNLTDTIRL